MKSITIHGLDDDLDQGIRKLAREKGLSLNKTMKELLRKSLGLNRSDRSARRDEFRDLCGVWSEEEAQRLQERLAPISEIDPDDWQ
jgi:DNA polymerase III delta subunit